MRTKRDLLVIDRLIRLQQQPERCQPVLCCSAITVRLRGYLEEPLVVTDRLGRAAVTVGESAQDQVRGRVVRIGRDRRRGLLLRAGHIPREQQDTGNLHPERRLFGGQVHGQCVLELCSRRIAVREREPRQAFVRRMEAQVLLDRPAVVTPRLLRILQHLGQQSYRVELDRLRLVEDDQLLVLDFPEGGERRIVVLPCVLVPPRHRVDVPALGEDPAAGERIRALERLRVELDREWQVVIRVGEQGPDPQAPPATATLEVVL